MKAKSISIAVLLGCTAWTSAMEVGGIRLRSRIGDFELQGAGLLRKGLIFKIYVGALYLQEETDSENILGAVPKRLDIHYFHHTPKKHMIRVAEKTLQKNLTKEAYARILPKMELLHQAYINGKKGSVASLIYQPGGGLSYLFDDQVIIQIPDDHFANSYFKIWLGEEPSSRTIKDAMLKGG